MPITSPTALCSMHCNNYQYNWLNKARCTYSDQFYDVRYYILLTCTQIVLVSNTAYREDIFQIIASDFKQ